MMPLEFARLNNQPYSKVRVTQSKVAEIESCPNSASPHARRGCDVTSNLPRDCDANRARPEMRPDSRAERGGHGCAFWHDVVRQVGEHIFRFPFR